MNTRTLIRPKSIPAGWPILGAAIAAWVLVALVYFGLVALAGAL